MKNWEEELDEYIDSWEHQCDCAAHSEGQACCLEKRWLRDFIKWVLKEKRGSYSTVKEA